MNHGKELKFAIFVTQRFLSKKQLEITCCLQCNCYYSVKQKRQQQRTQRLTAQSFKTTGCLGMTMVLKFSSTHAEKLLSLEGGEYLTLSLNKLFSHFSIEHSTQAGKFQSQFYVYEIFKWALVLFFVEKLLESEFLTRAFV